MSPQSSIDEARLERQCIRLIQAVNRESHSVTRPDDGIHCLCSSTVTTIAWMYMDLERAVRELKTILSFQQADARIPPRPGAPGLISPLIASVFRMVYHGARQRQRSLESPLAGMVVRFDQFHMLLQEQHSKHNLHQSEDDGVDAGTNALLVQAESDLADVAIHTGFPTQQIIARRTHRAQAVAEQLWRPELRCFSSKRADRTWAPLQGHDLLPLWAGAALRHQARALYPAQLRPGAGFWTAWPLATRPCNAPDFDHAAAGQGAVDPLLNWLMVRGLQRYGFSDAARALADATLRLASRGGLCQGYDAESGEPVGATDWAPTAALVLDLLKTPYDFNRW